MTNISVNWDTKFIQDYWDTGTLPELFYDNARQALSSAEPGFSFNFFENENETLRNACTEVTSKDTTVMFATLALNMSRIENLREFTQCVDLATKFLLCGTLKAQLPYDKVYEVRKENRRLGLGLMGMHEWLLQRGEKYKVTDEMHRWLAVYKSVSDNTAKKTADELGVSRPVKVRAIAPTGSIGILAATTTGIEPLFAVAYKRRYLKGTRWMYQYVVDSAAQEVIDRYGIEPEKIESTPGPCHRLREAHPVPSRRSGLRRHVDLKHHQSAIVGFGCKQRGHSPSVCRNAG